MSRKKCCDETKKSKRYRERLGTLAYEAAVREAQQQEATLDDLRGRAIGILSAVVVATSIFSAVSHNSGVAKWTVVTSISLFGIGVLLFGWILVPFFKWTFVQNGNYILEPVDDYDEAVDEEHFYRWLVASVVEGNITNATSLKRIQKVFGVGLLAFTGELILWSLFLAHF